MLFSKDQPESSLYKYFHEFLEELRDIKQAPDEGVRIQQRLMNLLKRQELDASQRGGELHAHLYREAQYLMVAFADELFLHLFDWPGKATWHHELLEGKMFNSQIAGQKVFDELESLLNKQDLQTVELARLYLIILALGFEGKYRNITQTTQRNQFTQYRGRLFFFITRRDTNSLSDHLHKDEKTRIFPDAYKYTLKSKSQEFSWQWWQRFLVFLNLREPDYDRRRWLPPRVIWWHWLLGAMILGLVFSAILWEVQTADLYGQAERIVKDNNDERNF